MYTPDFAIARVVPPLALLVAPRVIASAAVLAWQTQLNLFFGYLLPHSSTTDERNATQRC